ncbi:RNA recognition motif-containing protein [Tulasnella sp. 419]|nr:RNA recognition motif-containing protein [Tulasnella sp. 419]
MDRFGINMKEQVIVDGRKVRLQWANRKSESNTQLTDQPIIKAQRSPSATSNSRASRDPNAIRTVVLANLPKGVTNSVLWKKLRKQDGAEDVEYPVQDQYGKKLPGVAYALFTSPPAADTAVSRLHAHVYKGSVISATLKKRLDKQVGSSKAGRLIIRNLPQDITENDLHALFSPYGPINSITMPQASGSQKPRFAFVWMISKADAENALMELNGSIVRSGLAADIASKAAHKKGKRKRKTKVPDIGGDEEDDGHKDDSNTAATDLESAADEKHREGRIIAVDWALSKDKWETAMQTQGPAEDEPEEIADQEDTDNEHSGDEDDSSSRSHDSEEESWSSSASSDSGIDSGEETEDVESMVMDEEETVHNPPPPEEGTTLFIRNLPFEATEDNLKSIFRPFGTLRYARITLDKETGRSKGTGFVCFWKVADADRAVAEAETLRNEAGAEVMVIEKKRSNPFSLLTPDPSSSLAAKFVLMGRTLDVTRAVSRDEAGKLKDAREKSREKKDARNLYLMKEGVIFPSSTAAKNIPPAELERRMTAYEARKTLLRSNPSLYISRTRLSIRQLPTFVTERVLKRLGTYAVRAFKAEVQDGQRDDLTPEEKATDTSMLEEQRSSGQITRNLRKGRYTGVKQSKITRQVDRIDPLVGKGRSRGYGFLELEKHADALRVLRWANNREGLTQLMWEWWKDELTDLIERAENKDVQKEDRKKEHAEEAKARLELWKRKVKSMEAEGAGPKDRPLLIEFSIENAQVTKRRAAREAEAQGDSAKPGEKRRQSEDAQKSTEDTGIKLPKRRKVWEEKGEDAPKQPTATASERLGRLIGKKRKERKAKRGGRS